MKVDWNDKASVIRAAEKLGPGLTVFKRAGLAGYHITSTEWTDRYDPSEVVYQTK